MAEKAEGLRVFLRWLGGIRRISPRTLICLCSLLLTGIGLMMVFSASAVELASNGEDNPFSLGFKEVLLALLGVAAMACLSRLPQRSLKVLSWPLFGLTIFGLMLVLVIGRNVGGNQNWIVVGGFSFQPSELAKVTIILWMATVLSSKEKLLTTWKHIFLPVVPGAVLTVGFILIGHDLGTAVIVMCIVASGLFFAGVPGIIFVAAGGFGLFSAIIIALTSSNRVGRLGAWLGKCAPGEDPYGLCDQAQNGLYALASGRWFGVGLGQGRQKWSWIPEAHNDFIFTIIGEELGLVGTFAVVALYTVLAISLGRLAMSNNDVFVRVICGSTMVWIAGQAFVNIAMVTGVLPVIGVPLPFISYGGTALAVGLAGIGIVLGVTKRDPVRTADRSRVSAQQGG